MDSYEYSVLNTIQRGTDPKIGGSWVGYHDIEEPDQSMGIILDRLLNRGLIENLGVRYGKVWMRLTPAGYEAHKRAKFHYELRHKS